MFSRPPSLFTKLPDEGPLLETSKILSYFSGRSKPNLLRRYLVSSYSLLLSVINHLKLPLTFACISFRDFSGGLEAVTYTDVIQCKIMLLGGVVLSGLGMMQQIFRLRKYMMGCTI